MTAGGVSTYEKWVLALRTWQKDPTYDLGDLPALTVDSLPPSAYERLMSHFGRAQAALMELWSTRFLRDWAAARSAHDQMRVLVDLRALLGRRLQLARHPGLPQEFRDALEEAVASDIRRMQDDLEKQATRAVAGAHSQRNEQERMLHLLRTNSLTAILEPGFPLGSLLTPGTHPAPSTTPPAPTSPAPLPPAAGAGQIRRRSIVLDLGEQH